MDINNKPADYAYFSKTYAYQGEVKDSPLIQAWLARIAETLSNMDEIEVTFVPNMNSEPFQALKNQKVAKFLNPMIASANEDECFDEETLPYYRVRFSDGVELLADETELISSDARLEDLIYAVSCAYGNARELGYVGPWDLAANGTEEQKTQFLAAFKAGKVILPSD